MQLSKKTIRIIGEMICGRTGSGYEGFNHPNFRYRSGPDLTRFFDECDLDFEHDNSGRHSWVVGVLTDLNTGVASYPQLPADAIIRVIQELLDVENFRASLPEARSGALDDLNAIMKRDGLEVYVDERNRAQVRVTVGGADSARIEVKPRKWNPEEERKLAALKKYLDTASEDDFTEKILVPLFSRLGFQRISVAGHKDKLLEYGKDLSMRFQLPTGHFIYFGIQVKKGTIDSAAKSKSGRENITEVLNQVRMMLDDPIFDPDVGLKVLVDHAFIVASGEITKPARRLLIQKLDEAKRRHIIFMDRDEIVGLVLSQSIPFPGDSEPKQVGYVMMDDVPF